MVNSTETTEVNANQMNNGRVIEEQIDAEQNHENEELKKAFPEEFPSDSSMEETIPAAEVTSNVAFDFTKVAKVQQPLSLVLPSEPACITKKRKISLQVFERPSAGVVFFFAIFYMRVNAIY